MNSADLIVVLRQVQASVEALLSAIGAGAKLPADNSDGAIEEFIAECVQPGQATTRTPAAAIRAHFISWHLRKHPGGTAPSQKRLGRALSAAGYRKRKIAGRIEYVNLLLRAGLDLTGLECDE